MTNDANEPELLRLGASLPIPDLDAKFIEFARSDKMKVVFNNTIVPAELKSLNAPDWKNGKKLKAVFKIPPVGAKARVSKEVDIQYPYCVVALAGTTKDRLIVLNWWAQLPKEKKKLWINKYKKLFVTPSKSAKLLNGYNSENPQMQGIFDSQELRQTYVDNSHSAAIIDGGCKRKRFSDAPKTNAQLRDEAVKKSEARCQKHMKTLLHRTRKTTDTNVSGHYEPQMSYTTNAHTPQKGRPKSCLKAEDKTVIIARNKEGLAISYETLANAVNANPDCPFEILTGEMIVDSLVRFGGAELHFTNGEASAPLPGDMYLEPRQMTRMSFNDNRDNNHHGSEESETSSDSGDSGDDSGRGVLVSLSSMSFDSDGTGILFSP